MQLSEIRDHIDLLHGPPLTVLSDCLRGFLVAKKNHDLIAVDFSAIEARVIAWLSGEEKVLDIFRGHGKIYEAAAADIYRTTIDTVTKDQRQIGKVAVLALGYGGGVKAFQTMAPNYGVIVEDKEALRIRDMWRATHPKIVRYWYDCERAVRQALLRPGVTFSAGPKYREVKYKKSGSFLWCQLPSKRVLCYPYAKLGNFTADWGTMYDVIMYMGTSSRAGFSKKWEQQKTYGGKLVENITQATARDLLAEAIVRLEERNYPVVMHVHDEVVCEVKKDFGSVKEVEKIVSEIPDWAQGLPITAEGWRGKRYRK